MCFIIVFLAWLKEYIPTLSNKISGKGRRCQKGFTLYMSECTDIDECDMSVRFCGNLHCLNTVGTYSCECKTGYKVVREVMDNYIDYSCTDTDECRQRNTCPKNALCQNSEGSYACLCNQGYDGELCTDIGRGLNFLE